MEYFTFLHIVALIYWLGTDLGVYYSSKFIRDDSLSVDARLCAMRIAWLLDLVPRIAMPLTVFSGFGIAVSMGLLTLPLASIILGTLVFVVWVALVIGVYFGEKKSYHAALKKFDLLLRLGIVATLLAWISYSLYYSSLITSSLSLEGDQMFIQPSQLSPLVEPLSLWLCAKIFIFALAVMAGIGIRVALNNFPLYVQQLVTGSDVKAANSGIHASISKTKIYVHIIWTCLIINMLLGLHIITVS